LKICIYDGHGHFRKKEHPNRMEDIEEIDQLIKAFKRARAFMEK